MMRKVILLICILIPVLCMAQGHKGSVKECAPMKDGKVVYTDLVDMEGMSKDQIFNAIDKWAKNNYGKDVFLSNVSSNKHGGSININSKVELLLNSTDKTMLKYKMRINCNEGKYSIEVSNIVYQYDPKNEKEYKTYVAEDIIANNGKSNKIAIIKDPTLFCNATFFFVENLFSEVFDAANDDE